MVDVDSAPNVAVVPDANSRTEAAGPGVARAVWDILEEPAETVRKAQNWHRRKLRQARSYTQAVEDDEHALPPEGFDRSLAKLVRNLHFETVMGILITLNCVVIGVETELCPPSHSFRFESTSGGSASKQCPRTELNIMEAVFTMIFVTEFFARLRVYGIGYYFTFLNACDFILVWFAGVLIFVLSPFISSAENFRNTTALRAFRLFRVARVVRMIPEFKEMWLLVRGLVGSLRALAWATIIIAFMNFVFAVMYMVFVTDNKSNLDAARALHQCREEHETAGLDVSVSPGQLSCSLSSETQLRHQEQLRAVTKYLGNLPETLYSLFQVMEGDSASEGMVRPVSAFFPTFKISHIVYSALAIYVLQNLVTAVIVNYALDITKEDEQIQLHEKRAVESKLYTELLELFSALDRDNSGMIDSAELIRSFQHRRVRSKLELLGLSEENALSLVKLLDADGDGAISVAEFVTGIGKLKTGVTGLDIMALAAEVKRVRAATEGTAFGRAAQASQKADLPARPASVGSAAEGDGGAAVQQPNIPDNVSEPNISATDSRCGGRVLCHGEQAISRQIAALERRLSSTEELLRRLVQSLEKSTDRF
mmetsp:Transcript_90028/g.241367  ORF Transcript_90028/g.241367 Transcript_90028/m.241367 type:complete len:596 (+) Transcript_90028:42-1829(+)